LGDRTPEKCNGIHRVAGGNADTRIPAYARLLSVDPLRSQLRITSCRASQRSIRLKPGCGVYVCS